MEVKEGRRDVKSVGEERKRGQEEMKWEVREESTGRKEGGEERKQEERRKERKRC